jgi:hypothetical protein
MPDDWSDWFRNRLFPDKFVHPDSPAGGTGTGFARPPGPQRYSWLSSRVPHPDSPAGRTFHWQAELVRIEHQEREDLGRQIEELELFLAKQSAIFREKLPDPSLRDIYDRQTDRMKTSAFGRSIEDVARGTTHHLNSQLQPLENQLQWFDANSSALPQRQELRVLLRTRHVAWEYGTVGEKRELLNQVRGFAKRFYEAASKNIHNQWADARRFGKQEELLERWKRQMLQHLAISGSGTGQAVEQITTKPERRTDPPARTQTVAKTWIEFQLVDEEGKPVSNASYKVKLPDGSIRNGSLDALGMTRFDDIDPGQCQITFTDIDANEWRSIN